MAELKEGLYKGRPLLIKMTESAKQKLPQLTMGVIAIDEEGKEHELSKNGGLSEEGFQYTLQDAETLGCDTSLPMDEWVVDPKRKLSLRVIMDPQYGPTLKSIFDAERGVPVAAIIKKSEMPEARKKQIAAEMAERIKALKAASGADPKTPF